MFRDDKCVVKLTYLVEILGKLSIFNKSMKGSQMLLLMHKVKAFVKKLDLKNISISIRNIVICQTKV